MPVPLTDAQSALAAQHIRLVYWVVRRMAPHDDQIALSREDMEQDAMFGLLHATRTYDPARGLTFATYAIAAIRHAVYGRRRDLAWQKRRWRFTVSLDDTLGHGTTDGDDQHERYDVMPDPAIPDPSTGVIHADIRQALTTLTARDQSILRWRAADRLTLDAVGERLGISGEAARLYEDKALRRLRRAYDVGRHASREKERPCQRR